jgi:hypothetical protein
VVVRQVFDRLMTHKLDHLRDYSVRKKIPAGELAEMRAVRPPVPAVS